MSYRELKDKVSSNESLLNDDKKKTIALLNTLNDLSEKSSSTSNFRELSSDDINLQRSKDSLIITFIEDFYAAKENLSALKSIQKEITNLNKELDLQNSPLEYLDIKLLYYFVIRENFDLRDFKGSIIFEDLGFSPEQMEKIRKFSHTKEFKKEIYKFKNIYIEESYGSKDETLARLETLNKQETEKKPLEFEDLPEDAQIEFLQAAEDQEVDLEKKLLEMDYTPEEIEEMLTGFEL